MLITEADEVTDVTDVTEVTEVEATSEVDLSDVVLEIEGGVLGFPGVSRFALVRLDDEVDGLFRLVGVDPEGTDLAFVVAAPQVFFPDYSPVIDDAVVEELALEDDALALVVLTLHEPLTDSTANLLAPVVLNPRTRRGRQVVLSDSSLPVRRRLIP